MANALLSPFITKLALDPLLKEVRSLREIHKEAKSLESELELIEALLRDADANIEERETGEAVRAWMKQIREAAILSEDVIDKYRYYITKHQLFERSGLVCFKSFCAVKSLKLRHGVASMILKVKQSLREIREIGQGYGLKPLEPGSSSARTADDEVVNPRLRSLYLEDDELVGIDSSKSELIEKLVQGTPERLAISLVGQGGIGKTTLARKVFDDGAVLRHFESAHEWITVSQSYDLKKILKKMKEKMCGGEADTIEDLIDCLRNYLQRKRYVIVFDDVWDERFWGDIILALPNNNQGSRIIFTTRNEKVSDSCKETAHYIKRLEPWSSNLARELFCKKAFRYEFKGICPKELEELSEKIMSKCQGLPLVIASIAGLLATKEKMVFEWQNVLDDLNSTVDNNSELSRVHKILSLSYYDLPHYLRPCLLYFCMFPEDYSISNERLYRLWIAEGFVKAKENKTLEEIAEEYSSELVKRNLVSLDQWQGIGEGSYFRVHDLMHDVIVSKAEELCFCRIWDTKLLEFRGNGRRLMISGNAKVALEKVESSGVRSLFLSNVDNDQLSNSFMVSLFKKFKLLEVLDVESSPIDILPKELGKMFCLKYLSLKKTKVKSLPMSIGKLRNLYSLDIRETLITELPKDINKLKSLRHILAYSYNSNYNSSFDNYLGVRLQEGFGQLEDLQTLTSVDVHHRGIAIIKELEKLKKLRWLDIDNLTAELGDALCTAIAKMNHLQRLILWPIDEDSVLNLQNISPPPLHLRDLALVGRLERLPEWISKLMNLRGLSLSSSRLIDDQSIKSLTGLPSLETLQLGQNAYEGEELHFEEGSFVKLKRLYVIKLDNLKSVKIDQGALPVLEHLWIAYCLLLEEVPSVQHLKSIKHAVANGVLIN